MAYRIERAYERRRTIPYMLQANSPNRLSLPHLFLRLDQVCLQPQTPTDFCMYARRYTLYMRYIKRVRAREVEHQHQQMGPGSNSNGSGCSSMGSRGLYSKLTVRASNSPPLLDLFACMRDLTLGGYLQRILLLKSIVDTVEYTRKDGSDRKIRCEYYP